MAAEVGKSAPEPLGSTPPAKPEQSSASSAATPTLCIQSIVPHRQQTDQQRMATAFQPGGPQAEHFHSSQQGQNWELVPLSCSLISSQLGAAFGLPGFDTTLTPGLPRNAILPKAAPVEPMHIDVVPSNARQPHVMADTDRQGGSGTLDETMPCMQRGTSPEESADRPVASEQRSHGLQLSGSQHAGRAASSSLQQPGSHRATHTTHNLPASYQGQQQAASNEQHANYSQGAPCASYSAQQQQQQQQQQQFLTAYQQIQQIQQAQAANSLGFSAPTNSLGFSAPTNSLGFSAPANSLGGFNMYGGGYGSSMGPSMSGPMDFSSQMYHRSTSGFQSGGNMMSGGAPPASGPTPPSGPAHSHQDTYATTQPTSDDPDDGNAARALKKARLVWTEPLHKRFEEAVAKLGDKAVPKAIMQEMNVEGLTRENVASHLQKYRLQKQVKDGAAAVEAAEAKVASAVGASAKGM